MFHRILSRRPISCNWRKGQLKCPSPTIDIVSIVSRLVAADLYSIPPSHVYLYPNSPHGQLENADALFKAITTSQDSIYHLLASRALVRTRLQLWDEALVDATTVLVAIFSHNMTLTPLSLVRVIHRDAYHQLPVGSVVARSSPE